jgi:hypothetical protein
MLRMRRAQLEAQLSEDEDVRRLARVEARLRLIESEGHMTTTKIETKSVPVVHIVGMSAVAASDLPCQDPVHGRSGAHCGIRSSGPRRPLATLPR